MYEIIIYQYRATDKTILCQCKISITLTMCFVQNFPCHEINIRIYNYSITVYYYKYTTIAASKTFNVLPFLKYYNWFYINLSFCLFCVRRGSIARNG